MYGVTPQDAAWSDTNTCIICIYFHMQIIYIILYVSFVYGLHYALRLPANADLLCTGLKLNPPRGRSASQEAKFSTLIARFSAALD